MRVSRSPADGRSYDPGRVTHPDAAAASPNHARRSSSRWRFPVALALALTLVAGTEPARAQDADPWFGRDKALHFTATASIALGGYGGTALATDDRRVRVGVGSAVALAAGAGKEVWDAAGHGDPSARDLVWDVAGTATGVLVAWTIDWLIHR